MPTTSDPSHIPHPTPDPIPTHNPCLDWHFILNVPGVGRAADCRTARTLAYLDAIKSADALADTICGQPLGCRGRLVRVNRVDVQQCVH